MAVFMDLRPLRQSPDFRRLWLGSAISAIGGQLASFAMILQVYTVTGSSLAVGAIGLAAAVPAVVVGLLGGSIVDAFDRRRLVLITSAGLAAVSILLAVQAFLDLRLVWPLYALAAVQSALNALNQPARRTFLPRLLAGDQVVGGAALNMLAMHVSITAGPLLAGALSAAGGLRLCYVVDAVSFAAALYGVARLPAMPPQGGPARPGWSSVTEGLRFIRSSQVLTGALLADVSATVLGMPFALFPAINADRFGGGPATLGLLAAGPAIGGVLGSALSGPLRHIDRPGRAMLVAGAVWGLGLAAFGLAFSLWLAVALLVLAGAADVISVVLRTTIIQTATPDRFRGRASSAEFVVGTACPQLGNFRAGAVATLTSPTISAVGGGLATVVGAGLVGLALPALVRFQRPMSPS